MLWAQMGEDFKEEAEKNVNRVLRPFKKLELSTSYKSPYHTPQPGMPTVWIILITTCAMKTKKKAMKLKELSVL